MNLGTNLHAVVEINGRQELILPSAPVKSQLASIIQHLLNMDYDSRNLSSLVINLSKREPELADGIKDSEWNQLLASAVVVDEVQSDESLEGFPDITWGEYIELCEEPIFKAAANLSRNLGDPNQTHAERDAIKSNFWNKYSTTKYYKLLADKLGLKP